MSRLDFALGNVVWTGRKPEDVGMVVVPEEVIVVVAVSVSVIVLVVAVTVIVTVSDSVEVAVSYLHTKISNVDHMLCRAMCTYSHLRQGRCDCVNLRGCQRGGSW